MRASLERLLDRAQYGLTPYEAAAWIVREGDDVALKDWTFTRAYEKASWSGPPPAGALAIVHTHPLHADPRPSSGDAALARKRACRLHADPRSLGGAAGGTIRLEAQAPEGCAHLACLRRTPAPPRHRRDDRR